MPGNDLAGEPGVASPFEVDAAPMTQQQFNEWAEQSVLGSDRNALTWRSRLSGRLELKLEYLQRICGINEAQTKKLRLAGHGDIKRLIDRLEAAKRSFALVKDDAAQLTSLQSDVQELSIESGSSLLEEGSLFAKTLQKSLSRGTVHKVFDGCAPIEAIPTPRDGRSDGPAHRCGSGNQRRAARAIGAIAVAANAADPRFPRTALRASERRTSGGETARRRAKTDIRRLAVAHAATALSADHRRGPDRRRGPRHRNCRCIAPRDFGPRCAASHQRRTKRSIMRSFFRIQTTNDRLRRSCVTHQYDFMR